MKFTFTKASVRSPDIGIGTHQDEKQRGLVLNVTASGRRFGIYASIQNTPTRRSIGHIDDWSVEAARLEAARLLMDLRTTARMPKARKVPTLGEWAEAYVRELEKKGRRMPEYVSDTVRLSWSGILSRPLDEITKEELRETHYSIGEKRGRVAANRAIAVMRTLMAWAIEEELLTRNPAKQVAFFKEQTRSTFLTIDELVLFRKALVEAVDEDTRDLFLLVLGSGLRRANATGLHKTWCAFRDRLITVPADKSKNGKVMLIPMSDEVETILTRRFADGREWCFPSETSSSGHLEETAFMLDRARAAARSVGITKAFTLHDMRRSAASRLAAMGASLPVVAAFLGHSNLNSVHIYARADVAMVREALARA